MSHTKHWSSFSSTTDHIETKPPTKRQKTNAETTTVMSAVNPNKNAHLKGRKRFKADLQDVEDECLHIGFSVHGVHVKEVHAGDDDGSIDAVIEYPDNKFTVNIFVSDTSEYPKTHTLFCSSPDTGVSDQVQNALQDFAAGPSRPIRETLFHLLSTISRAVGLSKSTNANADGDGVSGDETEEVTDDEDYMSDDDIMGMSSFAIIATNQVKMATLQHDFLETVAADYNPGFLSYSSDNFSITVSIPIIKLTDIIPPRALMAWDRALLSKTQHLCLLISGFAGVYPPLTDEGTYTSQAHKYGANIQFRIGLTERYKPGKEEAREVIRKHALISDDNSDPIPLPPQPTHLDEDEDDNEVEVEQDGEPLFLEDENQNNPNRFDAFSLSSSLESLMNHSFFKLVQYRRQFGLSWAGAEKLLLESEQKQISPKDALKLFSDDIKKAEKYEREISQKIALGDPLHGLSKGSPINLPLTAFCYLVRRLAICPEYCLVCHRKLETGYEALKPYVCDSKLCAYQYYAMNRGAPLEYEIIHNQNTVDLLVSFAYTSAVEGALEDPPIGMGLRVPLPNSGINGTTTNRPYNMQHQQPPMDEDGNDGNTNKKRGKVVADENGLCDFDLLDLPRMRTAIVQQIDSLPMIYTMRNHLIQKKEHGKKKPKLQDLDLNILPAAWSILRWCVASCTAYIEEISNKNELVQGLGHTWRQFRFSVGAPDAESKFQQAITEAKSQSSRAADCPVLYAFHGSPLKNWHSIIRQGLWYKTVAHGRAYGDGVYLAKDASISSGGYSRPGTVWKNSYISGAICFALVEVVNLPEKFVSQNPYFVISQTHWILCRYLLVGGREVQVPDIPGEYDGRTAFVKMDKTHKTTMGKNDIQIPDPSYRINTLIRERWHEHYDEDRDEDDRIVFDYFPLQPSQSQSQSQYRHDDDAPASSSKKKQLVKDDWKHHSDHVTAAVERMMPPPEDSSTTAILALQRELKSMIKEQNNAPSLKELGWYMPPEFNEDNLFQWVVEMHSFDPDIPIAKDLKAKKINSVIFEIRFPATFPHSPPFFRILTPRFLPFIRGGGGHVTGGGSICMDLLTADGWSPSYSIPAVLMQIKLALSNLDPRPARLDPHNWGGFYASSEALEGYLRAATTHGWRVPDGLRKLVGY